jgi:hypothetical protein
VPVVDKYQHFEISDYLKKKRKIADALHTSGQIKFLEQKLVCSIGKPLHLAISNRHSGVSFSARAFPPSSPPFSYYRPFSL